MFNAQHGKTPQARLAILSKTEQLYNVERKSICDTGICEKLTLGGHVCLHGVKWTATSSRAVLAQWLRRNRTRRLQGPENCAVLSNSTGASAEFLFNASPVDDGGVSERERLLKKKKKTLKRRSSVEKRRRGGPNCIKDRKNWTHQAKLFGPHKKSLTSHSANLNVSRARPL